MFRSLTHLSICHFIYKVIMDVRKVKLSPVPRAPCPTIFALVSYLLEGHDPELRHCEVLRKIPFLAAFVPSFPPGADGWSACMN